MNVALGASASGATVERRRWPGPRNIVTLEELNQLPQGQARTALERCCGASAWVEQMCAERPFRGRGELMGASERIWRSLGGPAWREAFAHHPRIGDVDSQSQRFASTAGWAAEEQRSAALASESTLARLAAANRTYEERFGYIFIVCATGKSAEEMLALLEARLCNDPEVELKIAAEEQMKITRLRLEKLLEGAP
jgi:2-oxo-4-hydroxy-4-carboxy-5-ureidoimidazoline decarboxylase